MALRTLWNRIRVAAGKPDVAPLVERALDLADAGQNREAQALCEEILTISPGEARALHLTGVLALRAGDLGAAEAAIQRAIASDGTVALFHFNLGNVHAARGDHSAAALAFAQSIRINPDSVPARFNLAKAQIELRRFDEAISHLKAADHLDSDNALILVELGTALYRKANTTHLVADYVSAMEYFNRALTLPAIDNDSRKNATLFLGDCLDKSRQHGKALEIFRKILESEPDNTDALVKTANCLSQLGRMAEALPYSERIAALAPDNLAALSAIICTVDYLDTFNPEQNSKLRFSLARKFSARMSRAVWPNDPNPVRRIRIGYVSPDLRTHVAMILFEAVLRLHDRNGFDIFVYDATLVRDQKTEELKSLVQHWREVDSIRLDKLPALIASDHIDILVDLAGHTTNNRLMSFAHKPAPITASWLAYPGSTGLPEIDYLISDVHTSPPRYDKHASETVWRLPDTRFCYQPPAGSPDPKLPADALPLTFGSFNNLAKINPAVLGLWRRILDAVPDSRLTIKSFAIDDPTGRIFLEQDIRKAGIDLDRVTLLGTSSYLDNFAAYNGIHIALDPFPFCGGLTSLDALWMGVPVITLEQELMAGRQTLAFLNIVGHGELVAADADDYVNKAVGLARSPERIAAYRSGLREAMRNSPLLDFPRFTRHLEDAYRAMWRRWCEQQKS